MPTAVKLTTDSLLAFDHTALAAGAAFGLRKPAASKLLLAYVLLLIFTHTHKLKVRKFTGAANA